MSKPPTPSFCPFCPPDPSRVFLRRPGVSALWDGFPVSAGHALIVPDRHVPTWLDATASEREALLAAIDAVVETIRATHPCDGFNIGINVGAAAGQTVPHLHVHVIPRRTGDVPDPRGGVRHVIPGKGNYLATTDPASTLSVEDAAALLPMRETGEPAAIAAAATKTVSIVTTAAPQAEFATDVVLTTGEEAPLATALERDLAQAERADIATAFVMASGVDRLYPHLDELLQRRGRLRLVTGDYLGISDPDALQRLVDLATIHGPEQVALRMFVTQGQSFHPKAYLLARGQGQGVAYVGSSNLSASALTEGIEWNLRVDARRDPIAEDRVRVAFDALFRHPRTVPLTADWIADYRGRRRPPITSQGSATALDAPGDPCFETPVDDAVEPPRAIPAPNVIQQEALATLADTRRAGNRAGLVVMATGLGKTWLAAFDCDRPEFSRVLFVAHRDEILGQALATFRRIRPAAQLGLYNGSERASDAQVVFASIQTLGRQRHLDHFARDAFDYIVVDEFHHAAAPTYRRLIEHFEPAFLLGLTATPERSDGGDLLGLCGENLVYRCTVPRGIAEGLLCQFSYYGVPDEVDYRNIPWRNARFDPQALTAAVATQARSRNAYEQWRQRGGRRTIGFCVSQRHADHMAAFFREQGVACASVHAGPTTDPRSLSLERLAAGDLQVVFAVDMFNEGVDIPAIDTVMMLRPTESPIVWLQQFGRGLRRHDDKRLTVIDYIGNHRSFLRNLRTLSEACAVGRFTLAVTLEKAAKGDLELPEGCDVTYELQAIEILKALLPKSSAQETLAAYYDDFKLRHDRRPLASEAWHDGYRPTAAREGHGSWLEMAAARGDLDEDERAVVRDFADFFREIERTPMVKSYKFVVLLAMLAADALPGAGLGLESLAEAFRRLAMRSRALRDDVGPQLDDDRQLVALLKAQPLKAWTSFTAAGTRPFVLGKAGFRFKPTVPDAHRDAFRNLLRELADWRLAEYLARAVASGDPQSFVMKVSHAGGRPILFLPDRGTSPGIPSGWQDVQADGVQYKANFVKVAVNVLREAGEAGNRLGGLLQGWFGEKAGLPGTRFSVRCVPMENGWRWEPVTDRVAEDESA